MNFIYILGTAGSGKSALTAALLDILRADDLNVIAVNLDPGVRWLPYGVDVDIRDYINYDRIAEEYQLGPNGALIACVDSAINYINEMRKEIEKLEPDYVLIDTPGQMELFAYRDSGTLITSMLSKEGYSIIFLADSIFLNRPSDFVSIMLLSYSVHVRFRAPQINCISKIDLLSDEELKKACEWIEDPNILKQAFLSEGGDLKREISERIFESIMEMGGPGEFIFISSYSGQGMDDLYAQIQRIHTGGINI
ncbi:MAG: ATP/GTP-binding protein [Candidatus Methanomethylicaceae archaeon]|nr:ATP/GTP-binding protein [Candidatus Verstraetearchaeota archaeon]